MSSNIIKLNIGGIKYATTSNTTDKSAFLADLILSDSLKNEDNEFFLDRDGVTFRHILQYLRTGEINLTNGDQLKELKTEAEFFKMDNLVSSINTLLYKTKKIVYQLVDKEKLETLTKRIDEVNPSTDNKNKQKIDIIGVINYLRTVWVCPRNIRQHETPKDCGRKCNKIESCEHTGWVQEDAENYLISYEDQIPICN